MSAAPVPKHWSRSSEAIAEAFVLRAPAASRSRFPGWEKLSGFLRISDICCPRAAGVFLCQTLQASLLTEHRKVRQHCRSGIQAISYVKA